MKKFEIVFSDGASTYRNVFVGMYADALAYIREYMARGMKAGYIYAINGEKVVITHG